MTGTYLSYLPRAFIQSIAGFLKEGRGNFLLRAREMPPAALCSKIWPEADVWLEGMEAHRPNKTHEVVRLSLAGSGFLRLLCALQVILLQDSVVLRKGIPTSSTVEGPLLNCKEYW